ncbi:carbohydrate ABC transporter permease, partial [Rhizobium leguminosarum]
MKSPIAYRMMIWAGVVVLLIWSLGPIYWTIASSVTPSDDFSTRPINFFPQHFTLDHYSRLLGIN